MSTLNSMDYTPVLWSLSWETVLPKAFIPKAYPHLNLTNCLLTSATPNQNKAIIDTI